MTTRSIRTIAFAALSVIAAFIARDAHAAAAAPPNPSLHALFFPPIEVTGWIQQPEYDSARHQLVWSAGVRNVGAPESEDQGVNYNTYVLGREGYLSLNLVTSESSISSERTYVRQLLDATRFNDGRAYGDFDSNTDRVAAYGLAALVGGVAAKKLGLLAVAAAFLVKGWKLLLIGGIALAAAGRKFLGRKDA